MQASYIDIASKLQSIIDTAIDGIIQISARGIIEDINQSALNLFEYKKIELLGQNVSTLMPSPDREQHDQYIRNYTETRVPKIIGIGREVHGKTKSGKIFPFRLAVSEVILNDRVIYTGIVHDLSAIHAAELAQKKLTDELEQRVIERTNELEKVVNKLLESNKLLKTEIHERKKVEDQLIDKEHLLKDALKKEIELNELKSRFLSMASHEFRTPLSTILSSASLISRYQEKDQEHKRVRHIERIKSAVTNLTGILNDFLSLGKLEEGKIRHTPAVLDFTTLVQEIKEDVEGLLQSGQQINTEVIGDVFPVVSDARIIKNILFNLLSNAIKYSINGESVLCRLNYSEQQVVIEIVDQGIGISVADQKHLFDRFFRASNVDTIQGTGLGLNIVLKYLELVQGSISFVSELDVGSTFTITIPKRIKA